MMVIFPIGGLLNSCLLDNYHKLKWEQEQDHELSQSESDASKSRRLNLTDVFTSIVHSFPESWSSNGIYDCNANFTQVRYNETEPCGNCTVAYVFEMTLDSTNCSNESLPYVQDSIERTIGFQIEGNDNDILAITGIHTIEDDWIDISNLSESIEWMGGAETYSSFDSYYVSSVPTTEQWVFYWELAEEE